MKHRRAGVFAKGPALMLIAGLALQVALVSGAWAYPLQDPGTSGPIPNGGPFEEPLLPVGVVIAPAAPCNTPAGSCLEIPINISGVSTDPGFVGVRRVQVKFTLLGVQPCGATGVTVIQGSYLTGAPMTVNLSTSTSEYTVDQTIPGSVCIRSASGLLFTVKVLDPAPGSGSIRLGAVVVTDCNSVPITATAGAELTVVNPPALTLTLAGTNPTTGSNGSITATAGGGTPPFTYSKDGTTFQASNVFTGLAAGPFTITVKDAIGCTKTGTITLTGGAALALTLASTNPLCFGASTGSITASASGGTAPFTYSKNGTTFQSSNVFSGLAAGAFTITVKDATGATATATRTLTAPAALTLTLAGVNPTSGSNGSITATAGGGTAPFTYSKDGTTFQSSNVFSSLAAGSYTITVKDANACTQTAQTTLTAGGTTLALTLASTNPLCFGGSTGSITASASGGTAPLTYSKNGTTFQSSNVFSGLAAGAFTITVKDATGATATATRTLTAPAALTLTLAGVNPTSGSNGSITATAGGGTAPFTYSKDGTTFQSTNVFSGLAAGPYTITVKDANACTQTVQITLTSAGTALSLSLTSTNPLCFGGSTGSITAAASGGTAPYTYSKNGTTFQSSNVFSNLAAGSYTITVRDAPGATAIATRTLTAPAALTLTLAGVNPTSGSNGSITATASGGTAPFTYSKDGTTFQSSNVFSSLAAGPYTITVKDANACTKTAQTTLTAGGTTLALTLASTNPLCFGGSTGLITATGSGGTAPFTYSKDGTTFQSSNVFSGLAAGAFTITVKDATGATATATRTLTAPPALTLTLAGTNPTSGSNGSITATGGGGTPPFTYSKDGTTFQSSNVFSSLAAASYTITIKDANACTKTATVTLTAGQNFVIVGATPTAAPCNLADSCIEVPVNISNVPTNPGFQGVRGVHVVLHLTGALQLCTSGGAAIVQGPYLQLPDGATSGLVVIQNGPAITVDQAITVGACSTAGGGQLFFLRLAITGATGGGSVVVDSVAVRDCANAPIAAIPGPPAAVTTSGGGGGQITLNVSATPSTIWPPDKRLHDISVQYTVTGGCGPVSVILKSITASCPPKHDSHKADIDDADFGTLDTLFELRARNCNHGDDEDECENRCERHCVRDSAASCNLQCDEITDKRLRERCRKDQRKCLERLDERCDRRCHEECERDRDLIYTICYQAISGSDSVNAITTVRIQHARPGHADIAADLGGVTAPRGIPLAPGLNLIIPSIQRPASPDAGGNEVAIDFSEGGSFALPRLRFDGTTIDPDQIFVGNSAGFLQVQSIRLTDTNGDGFQDVVGSLKSSEARAVQDLPVTDDDPITLYYRTLSGTGYEVSGLFGVEGHIAEMTSPTDPMSAKSDGSRGQVGSLTPRTTQLGVIHPNPSREELSFTVELASRSEARLEVFDLRGALVRTLMQGSQPAGRYDLTWDGLNNTGQRAPSGLYLVRMQAGAYRATRSAMLVR